MEINKQDKIYIAGHNGMVGSAVWRMLETSGYKNLVGKSSKELDLRNQQAVEDFFNLEKPDIVILAAAKVGGIEANRTNQAQFIYDNLSIQNNVIHTAYLSGVKKLVFLGSSCIYPKNCPQPMKEEYMLTGPLEPTNEGYAVAKLAGMKLTEYYNRQYGFNAISLIPSNLYGINDSFDLKNSHVLSALVKKFVDAVDGEKQTVTVWGTGNAKREFTHVDDAATAIVLAMEKYEEPTCMNIGSSEEVSIQQLAQLIKEKSGFTGELIWDDSIPDGMMRKLMDNTKIKSLGFIHQIPLEMGVEEMINYYREIKSR